jgi:uncharacterized protein (DUF486 family)
MPKTSIFNSLIGFVVLLTLSNVFMTFASYAHLKDLSTKPWRIAVLVGWLITFFEPVPHVLGNRIGYQYFDLQQ